MMCGEGCSIFNGRQPRTYLRRYFARDINTWSERFRQFGRNCSPLLNELTFRSLQTSRGNMRAEAEFMMRGMDDLLRADA